MTTQYEEYKKIRHKIADLDNILAVLSWDQEVYMPVEGAYFRAQQISTLSGMVHELSTGPDYVDVLEKLYNENSLGFKEKRNVEESHRLLQKNLKLSKKFIERQSKTYPEAYQLQIGNGLYYDKIIKN